MAKKDDKQTKTPSPREKECCGGGCEGCPNRGASSSAARDGEGGCDGCERRKAGSTPSGSCCASADGAASPCCGSGGCGSCTARGKLHSFNYFEDIPGGYADDNMVEVQFKNTRKGFYINSANLPIEVGDMVAVEATPGHDIGQVTLTGALVRLQMRKANVKPDAAKLRVFRKAKPSDLERYEQAKARENDTMIRARKIASSLQLNMKIGDVEYQGDGNKAIFYYIADERVDFRQLIKVLAETFKVRIEMKQIGARQEAGRIGGIGPCGRPLCCSTWMTNFVSVSTGAARFQDISLNPQKLAGQCAKLKCCLNFEVDAYVEASRKLPGKDIRLETADATYFFFKSDIFRQEVTYSTDKNVPANLVTLTAAEAWEIVAMNKRGEKPLALKEKTEEEKPVSAYADILGQDSLTRFDNKKKKKRRSGKDSSSAAADKGQQPKGNTDKPKASAQQEGGQNPRKGKGSDRPDKGERPEKGDRPQKGAPQQPPRKEGAPQQPRKEGAKGAQDRPRQRKQQGQQGGENRRKESPKQQPSQQAPVEIPMSAPATKHDNHV